MIELSPETYKQIQKVLRDAKRDLVRPRRASVVRATYGKYAGKPSLTQALLKERKAELAREERKLKKRNV
jgi:hypothetical protein